MVTTRRSASIAATQSINAARQLRIQRRNLKSNNNNNNNNKHSNDHSISILINQSQNHSPNHSPNQNKKKLKTNNLIQSSKIKIKNHTENLTKNSSEIELQNHQPKWFTDSIETKNSSIDTSNQKLESKPWFDNTENFDNLSNIQIPSTNLSNLNPIETLFKFDSGLPNIKNNIQENNLSSNNQPPIDSSSNSSQFNPQLAFEKAQNRNSAIAKAAVAVMARMQGRPVSKEDYESILHDTLVDPTTRARLPPVLVQHYDQAIIGKPNVLFDKVLIEKMISATKRATEMTADLMSTSNKIKRHQKSQNLDSQSFHHHHQFNSNSFHHHPSPFFSQPLTEANLHRAEPSQIHPSKSNLKPSSLRGADDDRSGVVRTSRSSVRAAPYPRRTSNGSNVFYNNKALESRLIDLIGPKENPDDNGFSIHSASSSGLQRQLDHHQILKHKVNHLTNQEKTDVDHALSWMEDSLRTVGKNKFDEIWRGLQIVYRLNGDFISEAFLDHVSEHQNNQDFSSSPSNLNLLSSTQPNGQAFNANFSNQIKKYDEIRQPPKQFCQHPDLGPGMVSYVRVFEPLDSSLIPNQSTSNNKRIILPDTPIKPVTPAEPSN